MKWIICMIFVIMASLAGASPADARSDNTPNCETFVEFNYVTDNFVTKSNIENYLGHQGDWVPLGPPYTTGFDGTVYNNNNKWAKYEYNACGPNTMFIIYEKPNQNHPTTKWWVYANYTEDGFGERVRAQ